MKALRTQFARLSKVEPSGSGRGAMTIHQTWLVNHMEFLLPHVKARETKSTLQVCIYVCGN